MIPFFEGIFELYFIICLLIIPIVCCIIVYFTRSKLIWITPLLIFSASMPVSFMFFPYFFEDIFNGEYDSTTMYWLVFFIPTQIFSTVFFTGLTHIIIKIRGRRKKSMGI